MLNAENHRNMGYPLEDRMEAEGKAGAQSAASLQWTEGSGADERLAMLGYYDISKNYEALHLNYRTAVYGSVRTVV